MKKKWYQYLWIAEILYWVLGLTNILFAWLGLAFFFIPLVFAIVGGQIKAIAAVIAEGGSFSMFWAAGLDYPAIVSRRNS